jgi:serine/threonine protein kinase
MEPLLPMPGRTFSRYRVLEKLGAGGMGEVYRAKDTRLDREVAIKVLPADVASDPERLLRFEQEARAASALNHSNILTVYDFGSEGGTSYLVTELLAGESLRQLLRKGPLPPKRAVELALQIARGLAAAHEKGIVHRDLKPENLFLTKDEVVKILDFGLARLAAPITSASQLAQAPTVEALTGAGMVVGTVGYMAPEQVRGEAADARADLFAFGCVLYELLAGQRAFAHASAVDTLHAILHDEPPEIDAIASTAPPALADLLRHCLDKRRERRFQSAADLVFALEQLESMPGGTITQASRPTIRSRRLLPFVAMLAVAVLTLVGILVWRTRPASTVPTFERIAVLPFEVPGEARDDLAPIAEGLAQALINDLARLPDLHVTPWMTARRYADTKLSPQQLAKELGVESILSAGFHRQTENLRVDLALIEGRNGFQVWGDQVVGPRNDLVSLRSLVARAVASTLRPKLSSDLANRITRPVTAIPEAYELALKAEHLLDIQNRASLEAADGLLRHALELDPHLALARRTLGELEFDRYYFGWDGDLRNLTLAEKYFEEAIAADPEDPYAYRGLIEVHWIRGSTEKGLAVAARIKELGLDSADQLYVFAEAYLFAGLNEAMELFRRTLALDPANELALGRLGTILGGIPEGIRLQEEAIARFGETARKRFYLGQTRLEAGDLVGAELDLRRALELSPDDIIFYSRLGMVLEKSGRTREAGAVWRRGLELTRKMLEGSPKSTRLRGFALTLAALLGDRAMVEREERALTTNQSEIERDKLSLAHALLGEDDRAFAILLDAGSGRAASIPEYFDQLSIWGLERLANHPRYQEAMARRKARQDELLARYPID